MKITDLTSNRTLRLDSSSKTYPASLFLTIGTTICIEVDRNEFLKKFVAEFGNLVT